MEGELSKYVCFCIVSLNSWCLTFYPFVSTVISLLTALEPANFSSRLELAATLQEQARNSTSGDKNWRRRGRHVLDTICCWEYDDERAFSHFFAHPLSRIIEPKKCYLNETKPVQQRNAIYVKRGSWKSGQNFETRMRFKYFKSHSTTIFHKHYTSTLIILSYLTRNTERQARFSIIFIAT